MATGDKPQDNPAPPAPQGGPEDTPQAPPAWKPFVYQGKTFDSEEALTAHIDSLGRDIEALRQKPPPAPPPVSQAVPAASPAQAPGAVPGTTGPKKYTDDELVTLILSKPNEVLDGLREDVRQEVRREEASRQVMARWWDDFWDSNPELKSHKAVVEMVMQGSMPELAPMTLQAAASRLAEKSRSTIIGINKDAFVKPGDAKPGKAVVEGASGGTPPRQTPEPPANRSLSSIIKERARQRQQPAATRH
jgi:hypothetical protein